jgi:hypothetical protein
MKEDVTMDTNNSSECPFIGDAIPWEIIKREQCRVKRFTPFSVIVSGKIKLDKLTRSYAFLLIELPKIEKIELPREAFMPVVNRDDFRRLWEVYKERGVRSEEEVIIFHETFYRNSILSNFMARLHIYIYPKGHFEQMQDPNLEPEGSTLEWLTVIAEYLPKYYKYHR